MPLPGGTDAGGSRSEAVASQYCAVAGTASSTDAGHDGTENAAVAALDCGGIIADTPGSHRDDGGVTCSRYEPPLGHAGSAKFRSNLYQPSASVT